MVSVQDSKGEAGRALRARQILRFLDNVTKSSAKHRNNASKILQEIDPGYVKTRKLAAKTGDKGPDRERWPPRWGRSDKILAGYIKLHFRRWIQKQGNDGVDEVFGKKDDNAADGVAKERIAVDQEIQQNVNSTSLKDIQPGYSLAVPDPTNFECYEDYVKFLRRNLPRWHQSSVAESPQVKFDGRWREWLRRIRQIKNSKWPRA